MKPRAFPLAAACLLAITSRTAGQDVDILTEVLVGLDGLEVMVEGLTDKEREGGLTEDALQTYLEMRLRQARIPILSKLEWLQSERNPRLYLNVMAIQTVTGGWTYTLSLEVSQYACIGGVKEEPLTHPCGSFTTWDVGGLYTTPDNLADSVRGNLAELMDRFLNDYLAVNP